MNKTLCTLQLAGVLLAASSSTATALPGWSTNLTAAMTKAEKTQQPILAYFTASWCGPCKLMARTTFTNQAVLNALSSLNRVVVDIDDSPKLAEQHEVQAVPTFQLLSSSGDEVIRATGYQGAEEFVQWLTNGLAEAKQAAARRQLANEKLKDLDRLLAAGTTEPIQKAIPQLLALEAERDQAISQAVSLRLKSIAHRDPSMLLDGLENPRLAVRIQVANLLREQWGETFDVDPWADAQTRTSCVNRWRGKLNSVQAEDGPTN